MMSSNFHSSIGKIREKLVKLISRKKCAKILSHRCQSIILHIPRDEKKSRVAEAATQDFFSSLVLAILIFQRLGVMQHYIAQSRFPMLNYNLLLTLVLLIN